MRIRGKTLVYGYRMGDGLPMAAGDCVFPMGPVYDDTKLHSEMPGRCAHADWRHAENLRERLWGV
jgi:hypothetical protein